MEFYLPRSALRDGLPRIEGAARAFADGFDSWKRFEVVEDCTEIRAHADWHLTKTRIRGVPHGPGPAIEYDAYWLARLEAGKIIYAHPYQDPDEAVAAF